MKIKGYVDHFRFQNTENYFAIFNLVTQDLEEGEIYCTGVCRGVEAGDCVELDGELGEHPVYGPQFKFRMFQVIPPSDSISVERYLASGAVKGIGPALAMRIIKRFGDDSFRIMEEEPERLAEVKGISERKAREIAASMAEKKDIRDALIFLQGYGVSNTLAIKIFEKYGIAMYSILKENPYKLAEDIKGVGFRTADEIARKMGIEAGSEQRMMGGMLYCLETAMMGEGHTYLPKEVLFTETEKLLDIRQENFEIPLTNLLMERKIVIKKTPEGDKVFLSFVYYEELQTALRLFELDEAFRDGDISFAQRENEKSDLAELEKESCLELDELQKRAVLSALNEGVFVLTGGPGTGKTTTIRTMIGMFLKKGLEVALAAPTGRAAKRMEEATGYQAKTLHRLLEVNGSMMEEGDTPCFARNEDNPLEADVIIVDEMSMVDIHLLYALLRATVPGMRLIMAGDIDQLPSVGPGNVLKDMISCGAFHTVCLEKIFRQAGESEIITNAHHIKKGEQITLEASSKEFSSVPRTDPEQIYRDCVLLMRDRLPKHFNIHPFDVQILTPMKKGTLGVEQLNKIMQKYLNPPAEEKEEVVRGDHTFRVGDKVMQMKNNYDATWYVLGYNNIRVDEGSGVFNGDVGTVHKINQALKILTVRFEDNKMVEYAFQNLEELELAYAVTIHKSQGSEYPVVILPLLEGPRQLLHRNLLYTAVTRASKSVIILGNREKIREMIANEGENRRYTDLLSRFREQQERLGEK